MQDCLARLIIPGPFKWELRYVAYMAELVCKCGGGWWMVDGIPTPTKTDRNLQYSLS